MARQIIRTPCGGWNVWSTVVDDWLFTGPFTEAQLRNWFRQEALEEADREELRLGQLLDEIKGGGDPYHQFRMTYGEAERLREAVHGKRGPQ